MDGPSDIPLSFGYLAISRRATILDTQNLRLTGVIKPTKPITPVFLCVIYPIDFYRPHFILPLPGNRVSITSGFLKLPGDADAFEPALSDGFGFFDKLFGGANHSPIA